MLENFTLDMVLFTIHGRNMLSYHMVQTLQRVEHKKGLEETVEVT